MCDCKLYYKNLNINIHAFTKIDRNYNKPIIEKKLYNSTFNNCVNNFEQYVTE